MSRSTVQVRISLSPAHAAALCVIAEHDAGGARADVSPVVAGLVRAELARRWPEAWAAALRALEGAHVPPEDRVDWAARAIRGCLTGVPRRRPVSDTAESVKPPEEGTPTEPAGRSALSAIVVQAMPIQVLEALRVADQELSKRDRTSAEDACEVLAAELRRLHGGAA